MNKRTNSHLSLALAISISVSITSSCAVLETTENKNSVSENNNLYQKKATADIEHIKLTPTAASKQKPTPINWINHSIKRGDTLSAIFTKHKLSPKDLKSIINSNEHGKSLANINVGKTLQLDIDDQGLLQQLSYQVNNQYSIFAQRSDDGFDVQKLEKQIEHKIVGTSTTIKTSLFSDIKKNGLSQSIAAQLQHIFDTGFESKEKFHSGDRITLVYEKLFADNHEIGIGNILAAELTHNDKSQTVVRYEDNHGHSDYYSPDGTRTESTFLLSPVASGRITSHFDMHRRHPVLKRIRPHKGVDFAAKTGTPIKSTAGGVISFRGWKSGYGRVIEIQHGEHYTTLYAHLSRFGRYLRVGKKVTQGQVIGYAGRSGMASGPHLHYELHVDGVPRNPLHVHATKGSKKLNKSLLADFKDKTQPILQKLAQTKAIEVIGMNESPSDITNQL